MSNLDTIISYTKLFQDVELSSALQELRNNPGQLQQYLQGQQDKIYKDVTKQKDDSFEKVYGDLQRATSSHEASLTSNERNKMLESIQNQLYNQQKQGASAVVYDRDLAGRKYEMNEWTINNKKDTLFVFSMLFILLCSLTLLTLLWKIGIFGVGFSAALMILLIVIFIFTIVNRSQYTDILRDKRYWNRRTFKGKYGKIPIPLCPGALSGIESGITSMEDSVSKAEQGVSSVVSTTYSATTDVSSKIDKSVNDNI
jgi:hypothetical protein